jgi:type IV secretory pathway component VirB8
MSTKSVEIKTTKKASKSVVQIDYWTSTENGSKQTSKWILCKYLEYFKLLKDQISLSDLEDNAKLQNKNRS